MTSIAPDHEKRNQHPRTSFLFIAPAASRFGTSGAVYLSYLMALHRSARNDEGWFRLNLVAVHEFTGLSAYEQRVVRRALLIDGLFTEELRGMPGSLWGKINMEKFVEAFGGEVQYGFF